MIVSSFICFETGKENPADVMLTYLKGYRRESILAPLFKMLEASFDLLVPLVMASIINVGIANQDTRYILLRCGILVLFALIGLTCSITAQYFASKAAVGYATGLRGALFRHIQSLGFSEMDTLGSSTLITRMTSDVNQVQNGLNLFLRLFLRSPFIVFGSLIMAFRINTKAAVVFAVVIPALAVAVFGLMLLSMPLYKKTQEKLDTVLGITRENLSGVRVVRAFNREQDETDRFESANDLLSRLQRRVGRISGFMNPVTYVIINLALIAVLYSGAVSVDIGELRQGDVIALISYMGQILIELVKFANLIVQITKGIACAGRVRAILRTEPSMDFGVPEKAEPTAVGEEAVRFTDVSLTYAGAGGQSLTGISFCAKKGQTVGIIGGTGSGKSSLVNLIPRFYDATEGEVRVFDRPIKDYSREELRSFTGMVMQKALLFQGTIRSNLLWGNENASEEELWQSLRLAQAESFVKEKPLGLDEPVEQGGRNLSGGQRQRLTIARALVKKPPILILDDSSSALDFATDAALRKSLRRLSWDAAVILVSQRASSIRHADLILVLDNGALVGSGTHDELLKCCPVYKEIFESQYAKSGEKS